MDEGEGSGSVGMYVGLEEEEEGSAEHSLTSVNADGRGGMDRGFVWSANAYLCTLEFVV